jgi:DNA-binding transcriptional MocR family regulator
MARALFTDVLGDWSRGEGPLYERLARAIRHAIDGGDLSPGTRLPAQRALAGMLEVSRTTVVLALDVLSQEGLVESREGSGTRVLRSRVRSPAPRGGAAAVLTRRNVVFRGMVEQSGAEVEFLGAHFDGPPRMFEQILAEARPDLEQLVCGHGYVPLGLPALRRAIAEHLTRTGLPTQAEQVLVTNGAQQAIALVANLLVEPGDPVVLEDPTYLGAIDAFTSFGARLIGVPLDADGLRVDLLRDAIARSGARVVYLVPTCHNPTGGILPEATRRAVARIAEESGAAVIEDATLAELTCGDDPPPPIAALARGGTILTVGSLSKLFWGGLRVGWIRGPEPWIARLARLKVVSDLSGSLPSQAVAVHVLARTQELTALRRGELRERLDRMTGLLAEHLPEWSHRRPAGGLTLWVRIPTGDVSELAAVALRHGVAIVPGTTNSPEGRFRDHLRLPFVAEAETVREGIRRLAAAWAEYAPVGRTHRRRVNVLV